MDGYRKAPNIALIHCHDLGDWISCYGDSTLPTPNLQALAEEAIVFDKAFSTSPLCTPARSSLFTGRSPHSNGLMGLTHYGWKYKPGVITLPQVLGRAGYRTALLGLQHEDLDPRTLGYEEVRGLGFLPRALEVAKLTDKWMSRASQDPRPYLAVIGLWEVHRPWPVEDYAPADPSTVTVPPYLPDNEHSRRDINQFHGAIRQMDTAVGQILQSIDRQPNGRETLVIFTTDHGVAFPRAKSTLYDPGVKVAFLVRPPASWHIDPGRRDDLVSHLDVVPTLAEIAGVPSPADSEGSSLLPILNGESGNPDRELYLEKTYHNTYDPIRAIRTRTAKYIHNLAGESRPPLPNDLEESDTRAGMDESYFPLRPKEELYLLDEDPWEQHNRADDPELKPLREKLSEKLMRHLEESEDPVLDGHVVAPVEPRSTNGYNS